MSDKPNPGDSPPATATGGAPPRARGPQPAGVAIVQVISGHGPGRLEEVPPAGLIIGRGDQALLRIDHADISPSHVRITANSDGTGGIEDLGSATGTYLRGSRISQAPLADGDRFELARCTLLQFLVLNRHEPGGAERFYRTAIRDPLTGTLNRHHLLSRLREEFAFCRRHDVPMSVVLFGVDGLAAINREFGRTPAGDIALAHVAGAVSATLRIEDIVGRLDGDRLLIVAKGIGRASALRLAERLRELAAAQRIPVADQSGRPNEIRLTLSLGVAALESESYTSAEVMLEAAERALGRAKSNGRNRVVSDQPLPHPLMNLPEGRAKIGTVLLRSGVITAEQLRSALRRQKAEPQPRPLGAILVAMKCCSEADVAAALAVQYGYKP